MQWFAFQVGYSLLASGVLFSPATSFLACTCPVDPNHTLKILNIQVASLLFQFAMFSLKNFLNFASVSLFQYTFICFTFQLSDSIHSAF